MAVKINILSEFNSKGVDSAVVSLKKLAGSQLGVAATTAGLVTAIRSSVTAAIDDARSQNLLATALRQNTGATLEQIAASEKFIASTQDSTNVLDDQLRPAYASLLRYTKDITTAQSLLKTALDVSAGSGKDLGSVALALGKAYDGNFTALKRLGIPIDDVIIKSGDFAMAWRDLNDAFGGSQEAATKAEGALGDVRVAVEDLKESGGSLAKDLGGPLLSALAWVAKGASNLIGGLNDVNLALQEQLGLTREVAAVTTKAADAARFRSFEEKTMAKWTLMQSEATKKSSKASKDAEDKTKRLAKANKERLADALREAKRRLEEITQAANDYDQSIRGAIYGTVSLSDAVQNAAAGDEAYTEAIRERADAYAELNAVQARGVDVRTGSRTAQDAAAYADAMERVSKAEAGVTAAQSKRKSYTQQFREQLTAAKEFASSLQQLVGKGLNDMGLQQLLNLGPVAGAQVAKDLLSGASGLSIGEVNLTPLQGAAAGLGGAAAQSMFGAQMSAAQAQVANVQTAQNINVTVTSADPDKVVEALVKWAKKNGKLPSVIKTVK